MLTNSATVLITGAGGGLGQGLVREFLAQGWRVAAARHHHAQENTTETLSEFQLDVTSAHQVDAALKGILERWGRLDLLINNAGVTADRSLAQMTESEWDRVLAVNLKGAFLCSRAVLRPMLKQRDGQIINLASFSARLGARGQANYAAAKAGLIGLTQSLAKEAGSRNVRVNAILPGVLPTAMTAGLSQEAMAEFAAANALGRLNSIEEVARFIAFVATLKNVSGQIFQLDSRIAPWT